MKRIPRSFELGPHRIEVVLQTKAEMDARAAKEGMGSIVGLCDYDHYRIYILKVSRKFPAALQRHTFWHEYFHMLFHCAGRERLARDEVLVDNCGALQLQAFNTAEH